MQKLLLLFVYLSIFAAGAESASSPCSKKEYRLFDFWEGEWNVYSRDGKLAGQNSIRLELNGCVLKEHYKTASGYEGKSFNIFNREQNKWHQSWVDNTGLLLQLDGSWDGKSMILTGRGKNTNGKSISHRIRWTPQKNGDVHQVWDTSEDNGTHWKNSFFGVYQKMKETSKK